MILSGKGNGQHRLIKDFHDNVAELDYPFEVEPDDTSKIIIVSMNRKGIYTDNSFEDTGVLQFYGVGIDNIVNGNEFVRSSGIKLSGFYTYGGYRPSWYNEITNNHFKEGYYTHWFGTNDGQSGESSIWIYGAYNSQKPEQLLIATAINNNIFDNHSGIKITSRSTSHNIIKDILVQNNVIKNADSGISADGKIDGAIFKNNSFDSVTAEYTISPHVTADSF